MPNFQKRGILAVDMEAAGILSAAKACTTCQPLPPIRFWPFWQSGVEDVPGSGPCAGRIGEPV